ncbi:hypothetical protein ACFL6C_09860 [Myxococcota bacterium]
MQTLDGVFVDLDVSMFRAAIMWIVPLALAGCVANDDSCDDDLDCGRDYLCANNRCITANKELARRAQGPDRWGASEALPETVKAVVAATRGVVVRKAKGKHRAYVGCAADEQLVGGGCQDLTGGGRESDPNQSSFPTDYAPQHTLGARWQCDGYSGKVRAYALCLRLDSEGGP